MDETGYTVQTNPNKHGTFPPQTIIDTAGLDATSINLRSTVAAHLARKGVSRFKIEMQVGAKKTHWQRSIEDCFLYLY